jgi:hypothetical protein
MEHVSNVVGTQYIIALIHHGLSLSHEKIAAIPLAVGPFMLMLCGRRCRATRVASTVHSSVQLLLSAVITEPSENSDIREFLGGNGQVPVGYFRSISMQPL